MATINLLPWRDELREEQKQEFLVVLGLFVGLGVAIIVLWQFVLNNNIDAQSSRNQFLKKHITVLDGQVKEIVELKKKKADLVERMDVIQSLQGNRPEIVYIFDEIVRTLPDGVYYESIERKGSVLMIDGVAESNNRVSSLMRQLDASEWFTAPNLKNVKAYPDFGEQANRFELTVSIVSKSLEGEGDSSKKNKKRK